MLHGVGTLIDVDYQEGTGRRCLGETSSVSPCLVLRVGRRSAMDGSVQGDANMADSGRTLGYLQ